MLSYTSYAVQASDGNWSITIPTAQCCDLWTPLSLLLSPSELYRKRDEMVGSETSQASQKGPVPLLQSNGCTLKENPLLGRTAGQYLAELSNWTSTAYAWMPLHDVILDLDSSQQYLKGREVLSQYRKSIAFKNKTKQNPTQNPKPTTLYTHKNVSKLRRSKSLAVFVHYIELECFTHSQHFLPWE